MSSFLAYHLEGDRTGVGKVWTARVMTLREGNPGPLGSPYPRDPAKDLG